MMVIPVSFVVAMDLRQLAAIVFLMMLFPVWFDATAINFFSMETYSGTARGMEVSAIYLGALMVCCALMIRGFKLHLLAPGLLPFIILFFFSAISIVNADDLMISFFELWKMIMMLLVYLAVYNYLLAARNFEIIIAGMAALVLYSFVLVIRQKYFDGLWQTRGIFPHQNSMAMYLIVIGPVFLAGWMNTRSILRAYCFAMLFMVTTVSAAVTYSRGALLCYPISCAVAMMLSLRYHFSIRKMQVTMLVVVFGILITLLFLPTAIQRFLGAPASSKETRIGLAQSAWNMMRDKFLGVGVNNWNLKMRPPYKYSTQYERDAELMERGYQVDSGIVETVYLLVGAECGWLALGALLWWFVSMFLMNYRLLSIYAKHELLYLPAGFAGGLLGIYVQSLLEWVLKQSINFAQLMVVFAIISALYYMRYSLPSQTPVLLLREDF